MSDLPVSIHYLRTDSADAAREKGRLAARNRVPRAAVPRTYSTYELRRAWLDGFDRGRQEIRNAREASRSGEPSPEAGLQAQASHVGTDSGTPAVREAAALAGGGAISPGPQPEPSRRVPAAPRRARKGTNALPGRQTGEDIASLAARVLNGHRPTLKQAKAMAASLLSQAEKGDQT